MSIHLFRPEIRLNDEAVLGTARELSPQGDRVRSRLFGEDEPVAAKLESSEGFAPILPQRRRRPVEVALDQISGDAAHRTTVEHGGRLCLRSC